MTEGDSGQTTRLVSERLNAIEQHHLSLAKDVSNLTADVAQLSSSANSMVTTVENIARAQSTASTTNWATLAAWSAVFIILMGLIVWEPMRSMREAFNTHISDGHPRSVLDRMGDERTQTHRSLEKRRTQLGEMETRMDEVAELVGRHEERLLDVEREAYAGAQYRSGRPIISGPDVAKE